MSSNLDSDSLRTFIAVAECHGFTAAAQRIHRTQSAISQQIRRLEATLGVTLFVRNSRRLTLSREGEAFFAYAQRILSLHEEALAAVSADARPDVLAVGMPDDYAEHVLPDILPRFAANHPEVRPDIHCAMSSELIRLMHTGQLDLALAIRHTARSEGQTLCREPLAWVAGPIASGTDMDPVPLALFPEGCTYRARGLNALLLTGRAWDIVYTSQSPTGIRIAVEQRGVVSILQRRTVPHNWRILGEKDGFPPLPDAELELHRSPTAPIRPASAFADLLAESLVHRGGRAQAFVETHSPR
jgi:DNA-binding transcriptional LysR family regulator